MATIQDVARFCGVSPATVSLVLNNSSRPVSQATRDRVLKAVREMKYRPTAITRGKRARRLNTLGFLSGNSGSSFLHYSYFLSLLGGVTELARKQEQNVLVLNENLWSSDLSEVRMQLDGRCDGVVVVNLPFFDEVCAALKVRGIPFVTIGGLNADPEISCIDVDNKAGAYTLTRHLIEYGHRRIAMLRADHSRPFNLKRIQGFQQAMQESGIAIDPSLEVGAAYTEAAGYEATMRLLQRPRSTWPTALFCSSDQIAYGAYTALAELDICVPNEISIVGFDDDVKAAQTNPPLTTLRQPYAELGESAACRLLDEIDGEIPGVQIVIPGSLVVRQSVRRLSP